RRGERLLELGELLARRQLAVPEEVDDLLVGRVCGQVLDVVAAVGEAAVHAVEVADRRRRGDHALQPAHEAGDLGSVVRHGSLLLSESRVSGPPPAPVAYAPARSASRRGAARAVALQSGGRPGAGGAATNRQLARILPETCVSESNPDR